MSTMNYRFSPNSKHMPITTSRIPESNGPWAAHMNQSKHWIFP